MAEFVVTPIQAPLASGVDDCDHALPQHTADHLSLESGQYERRVLQRLVTALPWLHFSTEDSAGQVEVCLEEYYCCDTQTHVAHTVRSPLFRRVAVRACGRLSDSSEATPVMLASFLLPVTPLPVGDSTQDGPSSLMCWSHFEAYSGARLCVLTSSTTLRILDVFPHIQANMHTTASPVECNGDTDISITLPFPMDSIFNLPLPPGGILIQRSLTVDEQAKVNTYRQSLPTFHTIQQHSPPLLPSNASIHPSPLLPRNNFDVTNPSSTHNHHLYFSKEQDLYIPTSSPQTGPIPNQPTMLTPKDDTYHTHAQIPSLYTLHHPLHEMKPCGVYDWTIPTGSTLDTTHFFTQVYQRVLFLGQARNFYPPIRTTGQTNDLQLDEPILVVTFHTLLQRHALWILQKTPENYSNKDKDQDMHSQDSKDDTMILLPPTSPFVDMHSDISLGCIQDHLEQLTMEDPDKYDTKPTFTSRASRVFLATNLEETGDFLLCLVRPRKHLHPDKQEETLENTHILYGYSLFRTFNTWTISYKFQMPCRSAEPIQATPISPPLYTIQDLQSHVEKLIHSNHPRFSSLPWWVTRASNPPSAIDILVCRIQESDSTSTQQDKYNRTLLSLFRGNFHLVHCVLPQPLALQAVIVSTQHAVLDRVDVLFRHSDNSIRSLRTRINLRMTSSPVTEAALLAIGSAVCGNIVPCSLGTSVFYDSNESKADTSKPSVHPSHRPLALCLRCDTAYLAQVLGRDSSKLPSSSYSFDDLEWFAFSNLCFSLLGFSTLPTVQSEDPSDDQAWNDLVRSEYHHCYPDKKRLLGCQDPLDYSYIPTSTSFTDLFQNLSLSTISLARQAQRKAASTGLESSRFCKDIIDALHMLYEDGKITKGMRDSSSWIQSLGSLLYNIVHHLRSNSSENEQSHSVPCSHYANYQQDQYHDDSDAQIAKLDALLLEYGKHYRSDLADQLQHVSMDMSDHIHLCDAADFSAFLHPPCFHSWLEHVMTSRLYDAGVQCLNGTCVSMRKLLCLYLILFPSNRKIEEIDDSFVARALSAEGISTIESLMDTFNPGFILPILEALKRCRHKPPIPSSVKPWPIAAYHLIGRPDLAEIQVSCGRYSQASILSSVVENVDDSDNDGLRCVTLYSSMIFPNDMRITEAARLLRSSRPSYLHIDRSPDVTDHAYERLKQDKLLLLCRRKLALPLGRAMLTFGTIPPIRVEPMRIPKMSLVGRVPPTNATLNLDVSLCPQDMSVWPEFHNGVAAGLRLFSFDSESESSGKINRAWIISNKPTLSVPVSPESNGERANLTNTPTQNNHSHGGFLMALGFGGHLAALNITDIYEYLTQGAVTITVGVLLGMAANKKGTCDSSVTKVLCLHLPSLLPPSFATIEVTSTVQTAAITGIGLLYLKSRHRLMTEFLLKELGKRPTNVPSDREGYSLSCGLALGMINLCLSDDNESGIADLSIEERLHRYIIGGRDDHESFHDVDNSDRLNNVGQGCESERSSLIFEGDTINVDVTAPGAIIALGLMYIRSGNKAMASLVSIPDTLYRLDYVRPDLLFLRIVSRSLILWTDIEPSDVWVESQIPHLIRKLHNQFGSLAERRSGIAHLVKYPAFDSDDSSRNSFNKEDYYFLDKQLIRQSYAFILAGSCFSLGLRFAGSGNISAATVIRKRIFQFVELRDDNAPAKIAQRPDKQTIDMCLSTLAIALSLIMAGTGDIDSFRILRSLRWKCDETVKYGTHMAYGAAIGLLFLGGGSCTLGNSPADIAVLIASFFPRFPITTCDNQHHLQALRHLYALAVKRRLVDAFDVDSRESIFLPFEVEYEDNTSASNMIAPCLLQQITHVRCLRVTSERYYTVCIDLREFPSFDGTLTLFVKKKTGHMSFQDDPDGLHTLRIQSGITNQLFFTDLISSFTKGTSLSVYWPYLFSDHMRMLQEFNPLSQSFENFCLNTIYDCVIQQTPEMIQWYLSIYASISTRSKRHAPMETLALWGLYLIRSYCQVSSSSGAILRLNAVISELSSSVQ